MVLLCSWARHHDDVVSRAERQLRAGRAAESGQARGRMKSSRRRPTNRPRRPPAHPVGTTAPRLARGSPRAKLALELCSRSDEPTGPRGPRSRAVTRRSNLLGASAAPGPASRKPREFRRRRCNSEWLVAVGDHGVLVARVGGRLSRRGRFPGFWVARCHCGWRGPGRHRRRWAVADAGEHVGI